jgi:hypothetical protein
MVFPIALGGIVGFLVSTGVGIAYSYTLGPVIDEALFKLFNPNSIQFEGAVLTKEPNRNNRYCFKVDNSDDDICLNDRQELCRFRYDQEVCIDELNRYYTIVDGKRHTYNTLTEDWAPKVEKFTKNDKQYQYDKERDEYCYIEESVGYLCVNKVIKLPCLVDDDNEFEHLWCFDNPDWVYFDEKGNKKTTKFFDEERQEHCTMTMGKKMCFIEKANASCRITEGEYDYCKTKNEEFAWWKNQKHYYNHETEEYEPPLEGYKINPWKFDEKYGQECTFDEKLDKICFDAQLNANCQIKENGEIDVCWNRNGFIDHTINNSS